MHINYPCIIVELPHQTGAKAWIAYDEEDILRAAEEDMERSGWSMYRYDTEEDYLRPYGGTWEEVPEGMKDEVQSVGFPCVEVIDYDWRIETVLDAPSDVDFALEFLADDLSGLCVLDSQHEYLVVRDNRKACRYPHTIVDGLAKELGWTE